MTRSTHSKLIDTGEWIYSKFLMQMMQFCQDSKRSFPRIAARFVKVRQKRLLFFFLLHIYLFQLYLVETNLSNYISSFSWSLSWTILVIDVVIRRQIPEWILIKTYLELVIRISLCIGDVFRSPVCIKIKNH